MKPPTVPYRPCRLAAIAVLGVTMILMVLPACSLRVGAIDDVAPPRLPAKQQALGQRADALVAAGVPGVLVRVISPDADMTVSSGVADQASGLPIHGDTMFQLGAVSNTYLSTALLMQADDGLFDLGDDVDRYLPGVYSYGWDIAIYDLLQHASGIPDYSESSVQACLAAVTCDPDAGAAIEATRNLDREFQPGEGWSFSNTNYVIAGGIAEQIGGTSWQQVVVDRIVTPLGLTHTRAPVTAHERDVLRHSSDVARAHTDLDADGDLEDVSVFMPGGFGADGAMFASADDLMAFFRPLLRGDLLPEHLQTALFATAPTSYGPEDFGLGLSFVHGFAAGQVGHTGQSIGHSVFVEHDLNTDTTTVVVVNQAKNLPGAEWSALIGEATGIPNREIRERSAEGPGQLRLYCELY